MYGSLISLKVLMLWDLMVLYQPAIGAHAWAMGIASHGQILLSTGWLISAETPRHSTHLFSKQLNAAVKCS